MKKKTLFAWVSVLAVFFMWGSSIAANVSIDVNCTMKPGGSEESGIKKFKEILETKTDGRIKVKMFMSGQLGKEKAVLELLKIGQTQMAVTGGIFRSMFAKAYDPVTIPFYMSSWRCIVAYMDSPMGAKIRQMAEEKGGVLDFGIQKRAPREMTSNRVIHSPDDIKGLKMQLPAIPIWVDVWKEIGALPTVIPAPEIYLAMKTGQVEAHENSLVSPYSRKLWEVQKYIIMTDHIYFPWHWVASKAWFDKLDPSDQKLIREAADEARKYGTQMEDEKDEFYKVELKKRGMEFITPDNAAIRAKAMPAIKRAVANLTPGVAEEVEKLCK